MSSKRKVKKVKADCLPDKFVVINCPDKKGHEKWYKGRSLANFPCPSRILLCGIPNCGKSLTIKNILLHSKPLYDRLIVVSCTKETEDFNELEPHLILDRLPSIESFDRNYKNALVLDDYKPKTSIEKANMERFFGYVSTHCNTTIFYATQDVFSIFSPVIRRESNVFILWKSFDQMQLQMIAKRVGMTYDSIAQIMKDLEFGNKDSLCIDMTDGTPAKLRKNLFQVIQEVQVPDTE
jgi:hypothetical protein